MSTYPNTFYRVSVKAVIRNKQGNVLVVKENSPQWELPGGGLDHGESPEAGLHRELQEELGITQLQDVTLIKIVTTYREEKQAWLMWVVYEVKVDEAQLAPGSDVSEYAFIEPTELITGKGWEAACMRQVFTTQP